MQAFLSSTNYRLLVLALLYFSLVCLIVRLHSASKKVILCQRKLGNCHLLETIDDFALASGEASAGGVTESAAREGLVACEAGTHICK